MSGTPVTGPIRCQPWCEDGDGHTSELFVEDQRCYSPFAYMQASRADAQLGVHARCDAGADPVVELHVYGQFEGTNEIDETVHLTAAEACELAARLVTVAVQISRPSGDGEGAQ